MGYLHVIPGWFELSSLAFCIGVLVCRLIVFPASEHAEGRHLNCLARMWRLFGLGTGVMVVCTASNLLLRAVEMSGVPVFSVFSVLPTVLFRTHYGNVWIIRISAEILSLLSLKIFGRYRNSRVFLGSMACLMIVISATESASGHASDLGDFTIPEIMDWLHLFAASVWGGGLFVFSLFLLPELTTSREVQPSLIAAVARRFSGIAGPAVLVVLATAIYNGISYVGSFGALWKATYGLTVLAKFSLFLILINYGAFNHYVSVPLLWKWAGGAPRPGRLRSLGFRFFSTFHPKLDGYPAAGRFRRMVKHEALLILGLLFLAALLRHEVPARHLSHMGHQVGTPAEMGHHH